MSAAVRLLRGTRPSLLPPGGVRILSRAAVRRRPPHHSPRRWKSSALSKKKNANSDAARLDDLLRRLRNVDTAALCDADKSLLAARKHNHSGGNGGGAPYAGLGLMVPAMRPRNYLPYVAASSADDCGRHINGGHGPPGAPSRSEPGRRMVGLARTVQLSVPDDFLVILRALHESKPGDVLVVNTLDSTRAVAGGLFLSEASRRRMGGMIIDGPVRDLAQMASVRDLLVYSTSVTPYSGTVQSLGELDVPVTCGGVRVRPGDVIVGDGDGIVVGSRATFEALVHPAENIVEAERRLLRWMGEGHSFHSMTNYVEHTEARARGEESALDLKETRLVGFEGLEPVHLE